MNNIKPQRPSLQRSRKGCANCRRKKKKCDERKPTCNNCVKTPEKCKWSRPLSFLPQNALTINENPEPSTSSRTDQIINSLSPEVISPPPARNGLRRTQSLDITTGQPAVPPQQPSRTFRAQLPPHSSVQNGVNQQISLHSTSPGMYNDYNHSLNSISPSPLPQQMPPHSSTIGSLPQPNSGTRFSTQVLGINDQTDINLSPAMAFQSINFDLGLSPDILTDDGIFGPGTAYQELHSTLRQHVFNTALSQNVSRQTTPSADLNGKENGIETDVAAATGNGTLQDIPDMAVDLEETQEYILWRNWVNEIADWLDKFDSDRHFGRTLPVMAKNCSHLRYAMLALSARQLERRDGSVPAALTLSLYSAAVHLLVPQLHVKNMCVVASCVVICVLEMMSCSPKAWRRHLDGCACLIRSMDIRGDGEGIARALFWCFARMDVCGGLISKERTLIPVSEWTSLSFLREDTEMFLSRRTVDWHANLACYLVAQTLDLLFGSSRPSGPQSPQLRRDEDEATYTNRWNSLFEVIERWYYDRPPEMLPILTQSPTNTSSKSKTVQPFPTLLFSSGAAISGNQLHHTAALLMLQNIPRRVRRTSAHSILWHARRICSISIYNNHHGCWVNSVQPLWLAGQVMSHTTEHDAIITLYTRIEKETGWGATWRAHDLKQFWGEIE